MDIIWSVRLLVTLKYLQAMAKEYAGQQLNAKELLEFEAAQLDVCRTIAGGN